MQMNDPPFKPVGRCIYCRKTAAEAGIPRLQDEHIIAYALGGNLILPEASCAICAGQTSADEGYCAGVMLKPGRAHFGWRSYNSKRPKTLPVSTDGGKTQQQIPLTEHPPFVTLPVFEVPSRMIGTRSKADEMKAIALQAAYGKGFQERLQRLSQGKWVGLQNLKTDRLCRMLAKMAHSYTVARLGLAAFDPFLTDIILAKSKNYADVVGSPPNQTFPKNGDELHALEIYPGRDFISVYIKLYGKGAPFQYLVLSGRILP